MRNVSLKVMVLSLFLMSPLALADHDECDAAQNKGFNYTHGTYTNGLLDGVHSILSLFAQGFGNLPKGIFCHLQYDLNMKFTGINLPYTFSTSFNNHTIVVTFQSPQESWATARGYNVELLIDVDNSGTVYGNFIQMDFLAAGDDNSKGFLVMHSGIFINPLMAVAMEWDATDKTKMMIHALALQAKGSPSTLFTTDGDFLMTGSALYNASTKAVQSFVVMDDYSASLGKVICNRYLVDPGSILGGTVIVSLNGTSGSPSTYGQSLTSSSAGWSTTDSTQFISTSLSDSAGTADGLGSSATPTISLPVSCASVQADAATGGILANGNFGKSPDPTVIFANFPTSF